MRTERQTGIAQLEGMLMKHRVPTSDQAFTTLHELRSDLGNMTSDQISLIARLIDQTVVARTKAVKAEIIAMIENADF